MYSITSDVRLYLSMCFGWGKKAVVTVIVLAKSTPLGFPAFYTPNITTKTFTTSLNLLETRETKLCIGNTKFFGEGRTLHCVIKIYITQNKGTHSTAVVPPDRFMETAPF